MNRASHAAALALLLLVVAAPARASIDVTKCDDDGVTETPAYATRDGNQCLVVDPGNGDPAIKFQIEVFNQTKTQNCSGTGLPKLEVKPPWDDDHCNGGTVCSTTIYDGLVMDNYYGGCKAKDVFFMGKGYGYEHTFIRNTKFYNSWKCDIADPWTGPYPGMTCAANEENGGHTDGIQLRGQPVNGGSWTLQDSEWLNGFNILGIWQENTEAAPKPLGSITVQGVKYGRQQAVGRATTWITDCHKWNARNPASGAKSICDKGKIQYGLESSEFWLIDSWSPSSTLFELNDGIGKVVIVDTGCGPTGCGGTRVPTSKGWPHGIKPNGNPVRPGSQICPNGPIRMSPSPIYCYTSLENADVDHKLPNFAHLSNAGWANGAPGLGLSISGSSTPSPSEVGQGFTATGVPSNGTAPYTVTFDCDGDGACDDGSDSTAPTYTQACAAFGTVGAKTLKVCVDDATATPVAERTFTHQVIPDCGDGVRQDPEECDDLDNPLACDDFGYTGGDAGCTAQCTFDTGECTGAPACGDGVCAPSETEGSCRVDCAPFSLQPLIVGADGNWTREDDAVDAVINYRGSIGRQFTIEAKDESQQGIEGFRFLLDGVPIMVQNGAPFAMCGDSGPTQDSFWACGSGQGSPAPAALSLGDHVLTVQSCFVDWAGPNLPNNGGRDPVAATCANPGPTQTVNVRVLHTRSAD